MQDEINVFEGENRFLSNFYLCKVEYDGRLYPSVENAYQAAKTLNRRARVLFEEVSPSAAKRMGRHVALDLQWEDKKLTVMELLLRKKFSIPYLKDRLLATDDVDLIEGNWWGDTYWGKCRTVGDNHLGKLLMIIRSDLRKL